MENEKCDNNPTILDLDYNQAVEKMGQVGEKKKTINAMYNCLLPCFDQKRTKQRHSKHLDTEVRSSFYDTLMSRNQGMDQSENAI